MSPGRLKEKSLFKPTANCKVEVNEQHEHLTLILQPGTQISFVQKKHAPCGNGNTLGTVVAFLCLYTGSLCMYIPSVLYYSSFCGYRRWNKVILVIDVLVNVPEGRKSWPLLFWWVRKAGLGNLAHHSSTGKWEKMVQVEYYKKLSLRRGSVPPNHGVNGGNFLFAFGKTVNPCCLHLLKIFKKKKKKKVGDHF